MHVQLALHTNEQGNCDEQGNCEPAASYFVNRGIIIWMHQFYTNEAYQYNYGLFPCKGSGTMEEQSKETQTARYLCIPKNSKISF
jgi:hypothetical protein